MKKNVRLVGKILIIIILVSLLLVVLSGCVLVFWVVNDKDYVRFDEKKLENNCSYNVSVLDFNGNPLSTAIDNEKKIVSIDDLPKETIQAFLTIEDRRFFQHKGVDIRRIIGALIKNIKSGSFKEGASTITQQLAKNVFLSSKKSIKRKINEIVLAKKIEKKFSKKEILKAYLNTVYFGFGAYGIESASMAFFGVSASNLSLAQSAGLAGLLKAPNNYSPVYNFDKFVERKNLVLSLMLKEGIINETTYLMALNEKLNIVENKLKSYDQDYYDMVLMQACEILQKDKKDIISTKYRIETYFEPKVQESLVLSVSSQDVKTENGSDCDRCGIIIDNKKKGVKGFYGISHNCNLWNKKISPGSTIKPLGIYAPALNVGVISPITPVLDEQIDFGGGFKPSNYQDKYYGWTNIRKSVNLSLNIPAIKTLNVLGIDNSLNYLRNNGISLSDHDKNLTIALGNIDGGCRLLELVNAYSTLGNNGVYGECSLIKSIKLNGEVLYEHLFNPVSVFREESSFLMTDMLRGVVNTGTAKNLRGINFEVAGKTGTNGIKNGANIDAVFCCYTSEDSCLFWVGAPDFMNLLPSSVTGGSAPVNMAKNFFLDYQKSTKYNPSNFVVPKNVKKLKVNKDMLEKEQKIYLANKNTQNTVIDYFDIAYLPTKIPSESIKKKLVFEIVKLDDKIKLKSNFKDTSYYFVKSKGEKFLGVGEELIIDPKVKNKVITIVARVYFDGKIHTQIKNVYL